MEKLRITFHALTTGLIFLGAGLSGTAHAEGRGFIGGGMSFGQSYYTKEGASPGFALGMGVEPGFAYDTGSWSRLEGGVELGMAQYNWRQGRDDGALKGKLVGFSMIPRLGYGYSMGNGLFAVWSVGAGPVFTRFSGSTRDGATLRGNDTTIGFAGRLGASMVMPVTDFVDFTAGIRVTYVSVDVGEVKRSFEGNSANVTLAETVNVNVPEAILGVRFKFGESK